MAGKIPQHFIDEVLARVDIVDVIDSRVPLSKMGKDYKTRCPFHDEKTPSFTVSQVKQFYHCFGCGQSGTAITFLMEFGNLSFPEAIEELASQVGLDVPTEDNKPGSS
ncbi:MAG: CHC2 zinc finger domain-containing protein, partial [Gammaproteobacteria bacterium]|nr:CHC2 zinc finger domain-containing protein [Gammaproteobacteria bacterium]